MVASSAPSAPTIICVLWPAAAKVSARARAGFAPGTDAMTVTPLVVALIAFGLAIHALPWDAMQRAALRLRTLPAPAFAIGLAATMLVVDAMRYEGVAPFIYFRF